MSEHWRSYRDESRANWGREDRRANHEEIMLGCAQRIADATEKMAANYDALLRDRDWWKGRAERLGARLDTEKRRTAALRGVIGLMKRAAGR